MMNIKYFGIALLAIGLGSCTSDPNSPGVEYMPDMYRSPAAEAYVDYGEVRGQYNEEAAQIVEDKFTFVPPVGTIPYSDKGDVMMPYEHGAPVGADKTHGLYGVRQDSAGAANAHFDVNPIPFSDDVLSEGKVLYERFCIHCHGEKGAGDGGVPATGKFPPPNAYNGPLKDKTAGDIFYAITYGKNAMGSHASQINKEERWKLVHYVEKLQGKDQEEEEVLYFDANTDTDGDGVNDNLDECPTISGSSSNHGCPEIDEATNSVLEGAIRGLVFDSGSSEIKPGSFNSLNRVAELMNTNENYSLIINGHTDNTGGELVNHDISLKRARAVRAYLADQGVAKDRIHPIGYGQTKPIADNSTDEGKLANRRVEFRVY